MKYGKQIKEPNIVKINKLLPKISNNFIINDNARANFNGVLFFDKIRIYRPPYDKFYVFFDIGVKGTVLTRECYYNEHQINKFLSFESDKYISLYRRSSGIRMTCSYEKYSLKDKKRLNRLIKESIGNSVNDVIKIFNIEYILDKQYFVFEIGKIRYI